VEVAFHCCLTSSCEPLMPSKSIVENCRNCLGAQQWSFVLANLGAEYRKIRCQPVNDK